MIVELIWVGPVEARAGGEVAVIAEEILERAGDHHVDVHIEQPRVDAVIPGE